MTSAFRSIFNSIEFDGFKSEAGAIVVKEPTQKPWGQTVGYVRDLNGFLVGVCTAVESNHANGNITMAKSITQNSVSQRMSNNEILNYLIPQMRW